MRDAIKMIAPFNFVKKITWTVLHHFCMHPIDKRIWITEIIILMINYYSFFLFLITIRNLMEKEVVQYMDFILFSPQSNGAISSSESLIIWTNYLNENCLGILKIQFFYLQFVAEF